MQHSKDSTLYFQRFLCQDCGYVRVQPLRERMASVAVNLNGRPMGGRTSQHEQIVFLVTKRARDLAQNTGRGETLSSLYSI